MTGAVSVQRFIATRSRSLKPLLLYAASAMSSSNTHSNGAPAVQHSIPKPSIPSTADEISVAPDTSVTRPPPLPFPIHGSTVDCHADDDIEPTADIAPPLHASTTFAQSSPHNSNPYLVYSRVDNVTRQRVEAVLGRLDGGTAVTYASGLAAATALIKAVRPRRVYSEAGYHGVKAAFGYWKERAEAVGGSVEFITEDELRRIAEQPDSDFQLSTLSLEPSASASSSQSSASGASAGRVLDLIWLESPNNPYATVADLDYFAAIARKTGAIVAVDATLSSPLGQQPLSHGCDVVMHATTKYLGGHSDLLGGALVCKDTALAETLWKERLIDGAVMGNLECWLLLRSLRTFSLRVKQQSATVRHVLAFLTQQQKHITVVHHPSIPTHPSYAIAQRYLLLPPATFAIELHDERSAKRFIGGLRLWREATSLGGVESLVDWRYQYDKAVSPGLVRLSVGVEEADDLIADLKQALEALG